jgi:hypothetical protein
MSKSLREAQDWLRNQIEDGAKCPCCTQLAKVYRRTLTSQVVNVLIAMHRHSGTNWVNLPTLGLSRGDEAKARYWDLIEPMPDTTRDDGSTRNGWWRLTAKGEAFVLNRITVPKYARVYDGRLLGLDDTESVSVIDCLGKKFNYRELMAGV